MNKSYSAFIPHATLGRGMEGKGRGAGAGCVPDDQVQKSSTAKSDLDSAQPAPAHNTANSSSTQEVM